MVQETVVVQETPVVPLQTITYDAPPVYQETVVAAPSMVQETVVVQETPVVPLVQETVVAPLVQETIVAPLVQETVLTPVVQETMVTETVVCEKRKRAKAYRAQKPVIATRVR